MGRGAVVGMILGLSALTAFILFSVISLIYDDVQRHKKLEQAIKSQVDLLRGKYGCDDKEVERLLQEFEEQDAIEQANEGGAKTGEEVN